MLESLVIDKIIYILDNDIPIIDIPNLVIVDNQNIKKRESISVIENRLKSQINTLVLKYGIVETLRKLIEFGRNLSTINDNSNVSLLSIGVKTLYDRILGFYTPIVYARLVKWFPRLTEGTISSEEILKDIREIPFSDEFLLGITESNMEQINLFGDVMDDSSNEIAIALSNKNSVKGAAIKALTSIFSKDELNALCFRLSDILNEDESIQSNIFLRCFLKEISEVMKKKIKKEKVDTRQLKIRRF